MSILVLKTEVKANLVAFTESMLVVGLKDGREIRVPLDWFPTLKKASQVERDNYRFIGTGDGIHWETLDEDISVKGLLLGNKPSL